VLVLKPSGWVLKPQHSKSETNWTGKSPKVSFIEAVSCLLKAGFKKEQIGAYLLVGLPEQDMDSVATSVEVVKNTGITPVPAHYSPIPHTRLWKKAVKVLRYDLESDPVFTNNAIFPAAGMNFHGAH
jgi:radical SAM superfamily enzyme YgiQ (UPF0313 family)